MAVVLPAVRQPRLLDETTWREARRLRPNAAELHLKLNGISYGVLTMPWTDTVLPMRAWVEIYTSKGSAGLYRVTRADSRKFHTVAYTLQHAIDTLNDSLWREQGDFKGTAQAFLTKLLSFQRVPYWQLGTCEDTGNYKQTGINYGKLSDMLSGFVESRTGYYLSYDFSTTPWTVSWLRLPAGVRCEWRVRRNVKTCSVTTFDTDQCTRLYYTVSPAEGQEADPTVYTLDNTEQQQRGVYIEKAITIDADEIADPAAFAAQFMQDHAEPGVQIAVEGYEFARQTGDRLDAYELGDLARCIVDDLGPLRERIVALNYPDLIGAPESVSGELANNLPKFSESLTTASKTAAAAARSARANAKAVEKQEKEITHWSQIVTYHGEALDGSGVTAMYESGIDLDATGGATIYSLEEGMQALYSAIRVNASSIDMESQRILMIAKQAGTGVEMFDPTHSYQIGDRVGYTDGKMYEFTAAHSGTEESPLPWDPAHVQEVASLQDQITDNAGDIYDITQSAIMQNASSITGVVGKFEIDSQGNLVVKDGGAFKVKKNNVEYGLYSEDNLTAGLVVGLINNQQTGEGVTVARISADKIILDGTTTATTLDARLANVDDLFTNTGYAGTINVHSLNTVSKNGSAGTVTGDIITANTQLSIGTGTNGGSGNLYYRGELYYKRALTLGPSNGYIAEGYFLGNSNTALSINHSHALAITELTGDDAGKIQVTLGAAVSESSSERIKNFKIADTAYYKSRVGISNLSVTGGTDQGSQQDYSDSSAQVVTVVADGYYIVAADARDGTHEYKKFHVPAAAAPVTVNVDKSAWSSGGITFSTNPASGTGAAVSLAFVIPANTSSGSAQISVVDKASPGSSAQPLDTHLSKTLILTCDDNYATLKDGGTTVARVPNNKPSTVVTGGPITSIELRTVQISGVNKQYAYNPSTNEYTVYVRAKGTNLTDYDGQIFVSGTEARNSVTVTGISRVASCSFDQDDEEAVQDVQLTLSNGKTVTIQDVHFDDIYADGLHGRAQTTQVEFEAELSSGGSVFKTQDELYLNVSDIYQQGVTDAGTPSVTYVYIYASGTNTGSVYLRPFAGASGSNYTGRLYSNTKVKLISYDSGWAYVFYDGYYGYVQCSNGIGPIEVYQGYNFVYRSPKQYNGQVYDVVESGWATAPSGGGDDPTPSKTITNVNIENLIHKGTGSGNIFFGDLTIALNHRYPGGGSQTSAVNMGYDSYGSGYTKGSIGTYFGTVPYTSYSATHSSSVCNHAVDHKALLYVTYSDNSNAYVLITFTSYPT